MNVFSFIFVIILSSPGAFGVFHVDNVIFFAMICPHSGTVGGERFKTGEMIF